jgi:hypothetical protein
MPNRKKISSEGLRNQIHSLRGVSRRKPDEKPFAERWADYKNEEKEREDGKFRRLTGLCRKNR